MNIFFDEHKIILNTLNEYQVEFILVGGYAVIYHGYNRVTGDMDVWLKPDNQNKLNLLDALSSLGFDNEGISIIKGWDFTQTQTFYIGTVPERTDFMTSISGIKYEEAISSAIQTKIEGIPLTIIHIHHLIKNKISSGRTKDLADSEYLIKILNLKSQ